MSPINGLSSRASAVPALGAYELNSKLYGPAVASVIGAADALGDAAKTTASFSAAALEKAGAELKQGLQEVGDVARAVVDGVGHTAQQAYQGVADAGSKVADYMSSAGDSVADALALPVAAIGNNLNVVA